MNAIGIHYLLNSAGVLYALMLIVFLLFWIAFVRTPQDKHREHHR